MDRPRLAGLAFALTLLALPGRSTSFLDSVCNNSTKSIYDISVTSLNGTSYRLSQYAGKVLVIVNVASFWGLATPRYPALNALRQAYEGKIEILAFPCNQFLLQEPEANGEILNLLKYVRPGSGFEPSFPMHQKVEVNGKNTHALYKALKSVCPAVKEEIGDPADFYWSPISNNDITWNFQKFLIDAKGFPYKRYDPLIGPSMLKKDIDLLLKRSS